MSYREILREKIDTIAAYRNAEFKWQYAVVAADLADSLFNNGGGLNTAIRKKLSGGGRWFSELARSG